MSEWTLQSREAKLFIMGLAALAARGESGPGDPQKCGELASKFGAFSDFAWFTAGRSSTEEFKSLMANMDNQGFIKAVQDAITYDDVFLPELLKEANRRKLDTQTMVQNRPVTRKFSFDD